jgi:ligand-binding SRPBCC domain-containing protein
MIIAYRISPLAGIRMTWVTEITQVREQRYFVDEQRVGPYAMWHHEHWLKPTDKGVLMTDLVSYKLPLGLLGELAHPLFVRRQLEGIFEFRRRALETHFGRC